MELPPAIQSFCRQQLTLDNLCLPQHYPDMDHFHAFQAGYRYHGNTGEPLTSDQPGQFQPGWYVICSNYFGDPFFIDINEPGHPVYFSFHGAGTWTPIKVADSIERFTQQLLSLQEDEHNEALFDLSNEFWKEAHENMPEEIIAEPTDMSEWIKGSVYITNVGPQKAVVTNYLKELLQLTPKQALELSRQPEIKVKEGYLLHLKTLISKLGALGATAIFKHD